MVLIHSMLGCSFGHVRIDFGRLKLILFFFVVVWFFMSKSIMILKIILGKNENFSIFNSIRINFGHFFISYISKSNFDQYYPNINHLSYQITKHKSLYFKINSNQINYNKINFTKVKLNTLSPINFLWQLRVRLFQFLKKVILKFKFYI